MTDAAIEVRGLVKKYSTKNVWLPRRNRQQQVLDELSFTVPRGSICGFLGANGAGKTTTLRILMGFARANKGEASLLGVPAGSTHEIFRRVAYVPETKAGYAFARVGEMIRLTRSFYPDWDAELEARLLAEFELPLEAWCSKLSKGTHARLVLLLAVCRRPELLILDEPTDGLDPIAQESAMRLLVELAGRGVTVFFSTHHLNEVEQIADRIVMIRQGRCVMEGALDEIRQRHQRVRCVTHNGSVRLPAGCEGWQRDGRFLTGFTSADPGRLAEDLSAYGVQLLEAQPATLKEIFLEETRQEVRP